jgi:hypothetical protein
MLEKINDDQDLESVFKLFHGLPVDAELKSEFSKPNFSLDQCGMLSWPQLFEMLHMRWFHLRARMNCGFGARF